MTIEATDLKILKIKNEMKFLQLMPVELWRIVDDFSDAKTHTRLRASCSSMRDWIPREKNVEFNEYEELWEEICEANFKKGRKEAFQAAVHLNHRTMAQEHYEYLCDDEETVWGYSSLELLRFCRLALLPPFTCSHIDISACDNYAIRWASSKGHVSIVELLLADPRVDPAAHDNEAIIYASMNGYSDVVQLLLADPRVDPSDDDNAAIRYASENGHSDVVGLLLADPRVDPAAGDNEAIRMASENGCSDVVQVLLADPRVDPAADNNYAIRFASENGHLSIVELLLADSRVDPTAGDNEAIRSASKNGYATVVRILLAHPKVDPVMVIMKLSEKHI